MLSRLPVRRTSAHVVADALRWTLILGAWLLISAVLWRRGWHWGALWLLPGFVLIMNIIGFLMVPLYWAINARAAESQFISDLLAKRKAAATAEPDPYEQLRCELVASGLGDDMVCSQIEYYQKLQAIIAALPEGPERQNAENRRDALKVHLDAVLAGWREQEDAVAQEVPRTGGN
jgi:hypothetical protein